jgi:hypothetical protein
MSFPSLPYIMGFDIKVAPRKNLNHSRTHHVVIIVFIVIDAMLTWCYSIMSHATLFLFLPCIYVNHTKLFNITCTLVTTKREFMEFRV